MARIKLEDYVRLLDRMLERRELTEEERDKILNHPTNLDLISQEFERRSHPIVIINKLDMSPIRAEYVEENLVCESLEEFILNEAKRKKRKKKKGPGKNPKFRKVMREFGKGELKPYHSKSTLRNKKQGGTKKELAQAKAIAYSESGLSHK
jgi:hypothetical protein